MPSELLRAAIERWIASARQSAPAALSHDGRAVMIYGDIGGAAFIDPDGVITLEPWDELPENTWRADPDFQVVALVAGARNHPELAELLPARPATAVACEQCRETGWQNIAGGEFVCAECHGLGWQLAV
jgi:hypothetical protein